MPNVRMKAAMAGDTFDFAAGDVIQINDAETAKRWVEGGAATYTQRPAKFEYDPHNRPGARRAAKGSSAAGGSALSTSPIALQDADDSKPGDGEVGDVDSETDEGDAKPSGKGKEKVKA